jgi:hypothetical protein
VTISGRPQPPYLGRVPDKYDPVQWAQLIRSLVNRLGDMQFPSLAQAGSQYYDLDSLPTNGNQLRPGMVYRHGDYLKIVLEDTGYAPSKSMTLSMGTVLVST